MRIPDAMVAVGTLVLFAAGPSAFSQTEKQSQPVLRGAKERGSGTAPPVLEEQQAGPSREKKLAMCLETWDSFTHMTKKEWRIACLRSVRDYPHAFQR
jgi:hypothetical protein